MPSHAPHNPVLAVHSFEAAQKGPKLLILGGVHGNETCGTLALHKLIGDLQAGKVQLKAGALTCIPLCNPQARILGQRFVDRNLNRDLSPKAAPACYEDHVANLLCPHLEACDVLLDIHSYTAGGSPFVFMGPYRRDHYDFAACLGAPLLVHSWSEAHARITGVHNNHAVGTTEYARTHGASAVTLECGQHDDPQAPIVAYKAAIAALVHLGMIASDAALVAPSAPRVLKLNQVFFKMQSGVHAAPWTHGMPVKADTVFARFDDGTTQTIEADGYIIMPKASADMGAEWGYAALETPPPPAD